MNFSRSIEDAFDEFERLLCKEAKVRQERRIQQQLAAIPDWTPAQIKAYGDRVEGINERMDALERRRADL